MNFTQIVNPSNGKSHSIFSKQGKSIVANYLKFYKVGGMVGAQTSEIFYSEDRKTATINIDYNMAKKKFYFENEELSHDRLPIQVKFRNTAGNWHPVSVICLYGNGKYELDPDTNTRKEGYLSREWEFNARRFGHLYSHVAHGRIRSEKSVIERINRIGKLLLKHFKALQRKEGALLINLILDL